MKLTRDNEFQGIIFDDGVQEFVKGMRWPDDYECDVLATEFVEYFNRHFATISEPLRVASGITVIRTHCSVDKFPKKYAKWHDNDVGKAMTKHFGSGEAYFRQFGIPTFDINEF